MHQLGQFGYYAGAGFSALSMNYQGGNQSMVVLLPDQATGLAGLDQMLTADHLTTWLSQMHTQQVAVSLPSFQAQQTLDLGGELSRMGMPLAFSPQADFSGINAERLSVTHVEQNAIVGVGEQGTKAAAATGIVCEPTCVVIQLPPQVVFQADHPFVYLIRDNRTGTILFMGQEVNPTQK
jgi:serpin B